MPESPDDASSARPLLAFDVGARRTGVAIGNRLTSSARPLAVICGEEPGAIDELIAQWRPCRLVVGEPINPEGPNQSSHRRALSFAMHLAERTGLPVDLVDECNTSKEAAQAFARARRDGTARRSDATMLDAEAAAAILDRWFQTGGRALTAADKALVSRAKQA